MVFVFESGPFSEKSQEKRKVLVTQSCLPLLQPHGLQPARLLYPRDFPDKNTGVGCHFLFQGIFLTHGLNPGLLCGRQILYHLSHHELLNQTYW